MTPANGKTGALIGLLAHQSAFLISLRPYALSFLGDEQMAVCTFNWLILRLCATIESSTSVAPVSVGDR
ncbi:hypothetical protein BN77_1483 [Rhizobium mesoamericanum STM3625]|uniref:Uncharacterized protein n=1 Tax=Rhizobium mesoamericanum STM3625 TaxID=1211777 RepID=K0PSJ0_9HYPH|nr:hypothetical protein BN77_1483 [Rhizobium mesoamericanum STM3625]